MKLQFRILFFLSLILICEIACSDNHLVPSTWVCKYDTSMGALMLWNWDTLPQVGKNGVMLIQRFRSFGSYGNDNSLGSSFNFNVNVYQVKGDSLYEYYYKFLNGNYCGLKTEDTNWITNPVVYGRNSFINNDSEFIFYRYEDNKDNIFIKSNKRTGVVVSSQWNMDSSRYEIKDISKESQYKNFKDVVMKETKYKQKCLSIDTNTYGRWSLANGSFLRIFKINKKLYAMLYDSVGCGWYQRIEDISESDVDFKIKYEFLKIDKDQLNILFKGVSPECYFSIIMASQFNRILKSDMSLHSYNYKIGQDALEFASYVTPLDYIYLESSIDSMFYNGYDTIPTSIRYLN